MKTESKVRRNGAARGQPPLETKQLRELAGALILAAQQEQRRLADLLHDDLQQLLLAARLSAQILMRAKGAAKKDQLAVEISALLDRSMQATRILTADLSPFVLAATDLAGALQSFAAAAAEQSSCEITIEADPAAAPAEADVRVFLFIATRELVLGLLASAPGGALHIDVNLHEESGLEISLTSDAPWAGGDGPGKLEITKLRQWAALFGVTLRDQTAPSGGARLTLRSPAS